MAPKNHFTTRRGFIAASGFGGISLYGLWAAYGAAPGPLALLGLDHPQVPTPSSGGGHAGHGAPVEPEMPTAGAGGHAGHGAAAEGPSAEQFSRLTAEFAERYRMPDGSIYPRRLPEHNMAAMDPHAGHTMPVEPDPHAGHGAPAHTVEAAAPHAGHTAPAALVDKNQPIDVLMTAGRWYYLPNALRLDAGQPYRFKMMSVDIAHGASIQLGKAGRMMRLQPGRITEAAVTFRKPGRYLMYCTVYCGEAHQLMQATIEVV
ncbi:MAG: hypothetical protein E6Q78_15875 [Rhodoferax sp.]|nr:MAG: hypothetical protein E6Q78_15875 [Rhodoferax sp.]